MKFIKVFIFITILLFTLRISAQNSIMNHYFFSATTHNYGELTDAEKLTGNTVWDDPEFSLPIDFNFSIFGKPVTHLIVTDGYVGVMNKNLDSDNDFYLNCPFEISVIGSDLVDRGAAKGNVSESEIFVKREGNSGNRILKIEWRNVGFFDEIEVLGESYSYANVQLWIYEATQSIEIKIGDCYFANPQYCFPVSLSPSFYIGEFSTQTRFQQVECVVNAQNNEAIATEGIAQSIDFDLEKNTSFNFSTKNSVGILPISQNILEMYPNPANSYVNIRLQQNVLSEANITISDISGKILLQQPVNPADTILLNIENFSTGVYFVKISDNYFQEVQKLIVR